MTPLRLTASLFALVALVGAGAATAGGEATGFTLTSPSFKAGGRIPVKHSCDGAGARVVLKWKGAPKGTRGFAVLVDDPDAGLVNLLRPDETVDEPFVHLIGWGIRGAATSLPGPAPVEGRNDDGKRGWKALCPQDGEHAFRFQLYALKAPLALKPTATGAVFRKALEGQVLGTAKLVGRYGG